MLLARSAKRSMCYRTAVARPEVRGSDLDDLEDCFAAQRVIAQWIDFYNKQRPRSAVAGRTPAEGYRGRAVEHEQNLA